MDDDKKLEQQEVTDTDADTRDLEQAEGNDYSELAARMDGIEQTQAQMLDMLKSIKSAQADLVMTGNAVISENDDSDMTDGFIPLEELDFSIK